MAEDAVSDYGIEFIVDLQNGNTIRTDTYANNSAGSSYVRICDPEGKELAYWVHTEWEEDSQLVMGAILGCAGGESDNK